MAEWLNRTFNGFDYSVLYAFHRLAKSCGGFFTPFFSFITFLGTWGIFYIILGVIFCLFKNTRKIGIAVLIALAIDGILTNIILKPLIARPRPYVANYEYAQFWQYVGGHVEKEFSFPSGHSAVTSSAMTVLFIAFNKKYSFTAIIFTLLMGASRIYLAVHYPTDVLAGIIVGAICGTLSVFLINRLYNYLQSKQNQNIKNFLKFDLYVFLKNKHND